MSERRSLKPADGLAKAKESIPTPPTRPRRESPAAPPRRSSPDRSQDADESTKPKTAKRATKASAGNTGGVVTTTVSLPQSLRDQVRLAAATPGRTIAEVMLAAVEAAGDDLKDLVDAERPPRPTSGRFPDRVPAIAMYTEARVVTPISTTQRNLNALDQIAKEVDADSRSQLLTAALRAYFARNE
jgi:hypothetical protein